MKNSEKWWLPNPSTWKGTWRDDWRIMGQESYLKGKTLQHRKFQNGLRHDEHQDQCDFCYSGLNEDPENLTRAYYSAEEEVWICEECFNDFREHFDWTVVETVD